MHTVQKTKRYRVERAWQQYGSNHRSVSENLTIFENDLLDTEFEAEHWQDRVDELIPIGVSQFFFFDGEDIQKLADDSSHDLYLAESIKRLLGLNLVERLQSDLRIYANHLLKHGSPEPVEKEVEEVELEIARLTSSLAEVKKQVESLQAQIENIETQVVQQESRITAEGGSYVERRERLKLQQRQFLTDIEALENEIRDLCEGLFPFILIPDLLKRLANRLLKEIELDEWESKSRALQAVNREVLETLASVKFWDDTSLSVSQIAVVHTKIAPLLKTQFERPEELLDFKKIRDRSRSECGRLLEWIDDCLNNVPQEFSKLNNALKGVRLELQKVEQTLQKVPAEEVLRPLIEKLSALNQTRGQLHKQAKDQDQSVRSLLYQLEGAERRLEKLRHIQQLGEAHIQRQKRVEDVQSVLAAYTTRLTRAKIDTLGDAIVECFNQLLTQTGSN